MPVLPERNIKGRCYTFTGYFWHLAVKITNLLLLEKRNSHKKACREERKREAFLGFRKKKEKLN